MKLLADQIIERDLGFHYRYSLLTKVRPIQHTHDFYEFFITFGDQIEHHVNGAQQFLNNGSLVFIRPDDAHFFGSLAGISTIPLLNVAFRQETFDAMSAYLEQPIFISHLLSEPFPPTIRLHNAEQQWIKSRFELLAFSPEQNKSIIKHQFKLQLIHLFIRFFQRQCKPNTDSAPIWLNQLREMMQQKENFLAGLPRLIELSGRSHSHLNRCIQQYYGMTCTEWINSFKARHAAKLLIYTDMEIIDVVYDAGFENVSYFYEVFKRGFEMSPARYRRAHKKNIL
jgi:AraC family cel operon transcriptional repressor